MDSTTVQTLIEPDLCMLNGEITSIDLIVFTFLDNYKEWTTKIMNHTVISDPHPVYQSYSLGKAPENEAETLAFTHFHQFDTLARLGYKYNFTYSISGSCVDCGFVILYDSLTDDKMTLHQIMLHANYCAPSGINDPRGFNQCACLLRHMELFMSDNNVKSVGELLIHALLQYDMECVGLRSHRSKIGLARTNERLYKARTV